MSSGQFFTRTRGHDMIGTIRAIFGIFSRDNGLVNLLDLWYCS